VFKLVLMYTKAALFRYKQCPHYLSPIVKYGFTWNRW